MELKPITDPKPITNEAQTRAQDVLARVDAEGNRLYSQVRVDPETNQVLARDVRDHTKWTAV